MKIVHVTWDLGQGGTQTYLVDLTRELRDRPGMECAVLVLSKRGPLSATIENAGIEVIHAGMETGKDLGGALRARRGLWSLNPDVIHLHSRTWAVRLAIAGIEAPAVYTEHGGGLMGGELKDRLAYRIFGTRVACFIAISKHMAGVMRELVPGGADKIRVIRNGVSIRAIAEADAIPLVDVSRPFEEARHRIGFIGRLVRQKGVDNFIRTAKIVSERIPESVFPIIGAGPLAPALASLVTREGLGSKVLFLGYRPDALSVLKRLDVLLFTSEYEPFGLVLTEAMAAGVPIVAMDIKGAVSEILEDERTGLIVRGRDAQMAAKKVERLLGDKELRRRLVREATTQVRMRFSIQGNAASLSELYMQLLEGKRLQ